MVGPHHADLYPHACLMSLHASPGLAVCDDTLSLARQTARCLPFGPSLPHTLTHAFAQTALGVGSPPESNLGSESTLLVPASQASFCMALGCRRCFAALLRAEKGRQEKVLRTILFSPHCLRTSFTCTSVPPSPNGV